jgi:transcriptional regulator with XRE-family HTH domain
MVAFARWNTPLGTRIKRLRFRFGYKQLWLARAVGCSDAAISFWETGKRVPQASSLVRVMRALTEAGASPIDIVALGRSWRMATHRGAATARGDFLKTSLFTRVAEPPRSARRSAAPSVRPRSLH